MRCHRFFRCLFRARTRLLRTFLGSINAAVNHGLQHKHAHTLSCQMYMAGSHPRHLSFCCRNVPDRSGSAQGRGRTIHRTSLSIALFLAPSSCAASALALPPSVRPSRCLLLAVCLTTNAAQLRVSWMLGIPFSPLRLPSATLSVSALYFSWFAPSLPCVSCPLVLFLGLPVLASLCPSPALLHLCLCLSFCSVDSPAEPQG